MEEKKVESNIKKSRVRRKTGKATVGDDSKRVLQLSNNPSESTVGTVETQNRDNIGNEEEQRSVNQPVNDAVTVEQKIFQLLQVYGEEIKGLKARVEDQDQVLERVYKENEELKASKALPQQGKHDWIKDIIEHGLNVAEKVLEKTITEPQESNTLKELEPLYKESLKSQLQSNIDMNKLAVDKARAEVTRLTNPGGWRKVMGDT